MRNKLFLIISFLFFSFSVIVSGQKLVNSPYARFNLGILEPAGSFRSLGMGGVNVALRDNSSLIFSNPASYSSIDTNSFLFDFGIDYSINILSDGDSKFFSDDMNFDHLFMGFPLTKGLGIAVGLVPLSNGYYKLLEDVKEGDPDYDPVTGEYSAFHSGEGGLTNCFVGAGINLTKNLSAGINMTILFGQITRINQFSFDDYYEVFHNNTTEQLQISGINFDYGLQYTASLKKDYFINAGISLTSGKKYKSNYENLSYVFTAYTTKDTLSYISDNTTKAFLPGSLRAGIAFGKKNKFVAGVDFISTKWSAAKINGSDGYLADTKSLLFGAEFIPDKFSNFSFLKRIEYRLGAHFNDNYLILNGEQIKETGITAGIGLPMSRSLSKVNLFMDFTRKRGSFDNNLHIENYFTTGVSLNLYDFWFIKRKYN